MSLLLKLRYFVFFLFENRRIVAKYRILIVSISKVLNWSLLNNWSLLSRFISLHRLLLNVICHRINVLRIKHLISFLILLLYWLLLFNKVLCFNLSRLKWHFRSGTLNFSLIWIHENFMSNKGCLFIRVAMEMNVFEYNGS